MTANRQRLSLLTIALLSSVVLAAPPTKMTIHFFGSSTCGECLEIKEALLTPLVQRNADKLELKTYDLDDTATLKVLSPMEKAYGVTAPSPQELFLPDTALLGYKAIMASAETLIQERLRDPARWTPRRPAGDTAKEADLLRERVAQFTFLGVTAAGMVDGINPCAIATIIFLISFLATQKRSRREILAIGMAFTATVYLTYLMLGVGAFRVLTLLEGYRIVSEVIRWSAVAFAGGVSLYTFRDAIVFARTGKTQDIKVQLPKALKLQIHKIISGNISRTSLVFGAIVTGFLVTLLEAVCTGQVYLPTIILMTRNAGLKLQGWLYLVYYNVLFVLPLLIIMVMAYYGLKWSDLSKATQKHMVLIKILLGVVLAGLAVFLGMAG
jgi:cytochrome c biogenesis protein CcdA